MNTAIEVIGVDKSFEAGSPVLRDIHFTIGDGEMVALIGASGSGKSTLIRSIAGLVKVDRPGKRNTGEPPGGRIRILNEPMQEDGRISSSASRLRAHVGVIFQQFNLVPRLSVLTNVCLGLLGQIPAWRGNLSRFTQPEKQKAMQALSRVGIAEQALKRGSELSGGQQQRAAIARTLVQGAKVLIADEPIASLDPKAARRVMDILADLNRQDRITVLVSLHQVEYALAYCPRTDRAARGPHRLRRTIERAHTGLSERALRRRKRGAAAARAWRCDRRLRGAQWPRHAIARLGRAGAGWRRTKHPGLRFSEVQCFSGPAGAAPTSTLATKQELENVSYTRSSRDGGGNVDGTRSRPGDQLRHHLHGDDGQPQDDLGAVRCGHGARSTGFTSRPSSPPTTPA